MTPSPILDEIILKIEKKSPLHAKKLKKILPGLDGRYFLQAEKFFSKYVGLLKNSGKDIDYGIDCYLRMNADMMHEQIKFVHSGKYSCTCFQEAVDQVYSKPEIMEYYMHGLIMSQFLFRHHYEMFNFFGTIIAKRRGQVKSYLEIGAGHGLFIAEAMSILSDCRQFDVVDISPSSIDLARQFIDDPQVNYYLSDIYDFKAGTGYDFITMGEVIEHVEEPSKLLVKVASLLRPGGELFITVPANAPVIDHIYLFRNAQEIRDLVSQSGFDIVEESSVYVEDVSKEKAEALKVTLIYGALLKYKGGQSWAVRKLKRN